MKHARLVPAALAMVILGSWAVAGYACDEAKATQTAAKKSSKVTAVTADASGGAKGCTAEQMAACKSRGASAATASSSHSCGSKTSTSAVTASSTSKGKVDAIAVGSGG